MVEPMSAFADRKYDLNTTAVMACEGHPSPYIIIDTALLLDLSTFPPQHGSRKWVKYHFC